MNDKCMSSPYCCFALMPLSLSLLLPRCDCSATLFYQIMLCTLVEGGVCRECVPSECQWIVNSVFSHYNRCVRAHVCPLSLLSLPAVLLTMCQSAAQLAFTLSPSTTAVPWFHYPYVFFFYSPIIAHISLLSLSLLSFNLSAFSSVSFHQFVARLQLVHLQR